jgi:hypothetical protein
MLDDAGKHAASQGTTRMWNSYSVPQKQQGVIQTHPVRQSYGVRWLATAFTIEAITQPSPFFAKDSPQDGAKPLHGRRSYFFSLKPKTETDKCSPVRHNLDARQPRGALSAQTTLLVQGGLCLNLN